MPEELLLGWHNDCCLYRLVMMIDVTEWIGSSQTYVWKVAGWTLQIYTLHCVSCVRVLYDSYCSISSLQRRFCITYQTAAWLPKLLVYSQTDPILSGVRGLMSELKPEQHNLHLWHTITQPVENNDTLFTASDQISLAVNPLLKRKYKLKA